MITFIAIVIIAYMGWVVAEWYTKRVRIREQEKSLLEELEEYLKNQV